MLAEEDIIAKLQKLPIQFQREVLDFIDSLSQRIEQANDEDFWAEFSLSRAMHGLEDDGSPEYSEADIKKSWH